MSESQDQAQERTEDPTPRRRQEARDEGRVARTPEISAAAVLLAGAVGLASFGAPALAEFSRRLMRECARSLSAAPLTPAGGVALVQSTTLGLLLALLPFAAVVMGTAILSGVAQTGGLISWKSVAPQWSRLNPGAGLKRMASLESVFTLFKSLLKLAVLGLITWMVLARGWPELISLGQTGTGGALLVMRSMLLRLAVVTGLGFLTVALIDYGFQWFKLQKSLRMSRQDVVRENRESEGDPLIKARMLSIGRQRARQRMLQAVATADVVVVNPTHIAVALRYDIGVAAAPVVVAMGQRKLAERIRAIALRSGVPIIENRPVARALLATGVVGRAIPPALYSAIAEILAYVYRMKGRAALDAAADGRRA